MEKPNPYAAPASDEAISAEQFSKRRAASYRRAALICGGIGGTTLFASMDTGARLLYYSLLHPLPEDGGSPIPPRFVATSANLGGFAGMTITALVLIALAWFAWGRNLAELRKQWATQPSVEAENATPSAVSE